MRRNALTSSIAVLLFAIYYLYESLKYPIKTTVGNPGPGFLPLFWGVSLILVSLVLILQSFKEQVKLSTVQWLPTEDGAKRLAFVLGATVYLTHLKASSYQAITYSSNKE